MDFLHNWLYNMSGIGFTTFVVIAIVMLTFGLLNYIRHSKADFGSVAYKDSHDGFLTGIQMGLMSAFLAIMLYSVPEPDYTVKTVIKTKTVSKMMKPEARFLKIYESCMRNLQDNAENVKTCRETAYVGTGKQVLIRTKIKNIDGTEAFNKSYKTCIDSMNVAIEEAEVKICRETAYVATGRKFLVKSAPDNYQKYMDAYKYRSETFSLEDVPNELVGSIRNQRLAICKDVALRSLG